MAARHRTSVTSRGSSETMEDMARARLSLQVTTEDREALKALKALIPNPTGEIKMAKILRAVLRLGMEALASDPSRDLDRIPTPVIPNPSLTPRTEEFLRTAEPPKGRPAKQR